MSGQVGMILSMVMVGLTINLSIGTHNGSDEIRLLDHLLSRYKAHRKLVRPVADSNKTLTIAFSITLKQILDFDEKNHRLTTLVWKQQSWIDENLQWNSEDYGGIELIIIPASSIWLPDIILYNNNGETNTDQKQVDTLVHVENTGKVIWMPAVKYTSACMVDMLEYPFDVQTCKMKFGSWAYDINKIDIEFSYEKNQIDMNEYVPNTEWEILNNTAEKTTLKYDCCPNEYVFITYTLTLKRHVTFHIRLILVPTALLSVFTLVIFWIPPNRPDRTVIGLTLFSSFFLLLILVVNSSPPTATSKLGSYYIMIIVMVTVAILLSTKNINLSCTTRKMPSWIYKAFIVNLGFLLYLRPVKYRRDKTAPIDGLELKSLQKGKPTTTPQMSESEKWQTFALILDRIYFLVFLPVLVICFCVTFPSPINLFRL